ncbi:MAG: hypothetical protein CUN50_01750 [Candidatus Thermofonsia Clade 1 bacterium]|jgi:DNA-binding SARP family transcriptional activator|uniref:Zinc-finger domain-containing protein n=1 Tax=Candidatus Thermofonsia Clade 1 bacterium TaxID=2364210 RepID=A0A2M8PZN1_9CHLR|nr:MAG: hypothetical protein CUN50_01750 [Candidatus Thermofonsia Clade 1 bacterium]
MACRNPLPLSEDDLLEILIGEADPNLLDCLEVDEASRERYREWVDFYRRLQRAWYPSSQTLVDYVSELLDEAHHQAVSAHVDECRQCREFVEYLMEQTVSSEHV